MAETGLVYHPQYLAHYTGSTHPERKDRLDAIVRRLEETGLLDELPSVLPRPAAIEELSAVHDEEYILSVRDRIERGVTLLDATDTGVGKESWNAALLAAGGACSAVDAVMAGEVMRVFCAVRPPGHHARRNAAMGFCIFNNVAVAARYLQQSYGISRVAIIDWDVHHGNGSQEMFYDDPTVFYLSLHQFPHYPGTGSSTESGEGEGVGFNFNVPVPPDTGEAEYIRLFEDAIGSRIAPFRPEFIFISAGFDAHADDPLSNLSLREESYRRMTEITCAIANEHAGGRIVSLLEGGYELDALARSVEAHMRELIERPGPEQNKCPETP